MWIYIYEKVKGVIDYVSLYADLYVRADKFD